MLLLGNPELDSLVTGSTGYGDYLDHACALTKEQKKFNKALKDGQLKAMAGLLIAA